MNYCKDCRYYSRAYAFSDLCTHPAVREECADLVRGVPEYVPADAARGQTYTSWPGHACGRDGFFFEKRESLTYRFFRWLFGGDANGRKGKES